MSKISEAFCIIAAAILCAASASNAYAQDAASENVRAFVTATRDYVAMHRRLEAQIGRIEITSSIADINRNIEKLAAAIRAERPAAQQGDFFTPALGVELRAAIVEALHDHDFMPIDVINASPLLREWVDDLHATSADLDALAIPDEEAWMNEREGLLRY